MGKVRGIAGVLLLLASTLATPTTVAAGTNGGKATSPEATQEATQAQDVTPETAIRAELEAQVTAWNRADLKGYMGGYWRSPELTFFAGSQESAGWEAAYQRYHKAYTGKDKQMGKLRFTNIRVEVLSPESAFVRGGWELSAKDGSKRSGLFTLVLKQFGEGWRIIHDHSS